MKHLFSTLTLILALAYSSIACTAGFTYTIQNNTVTFHGTSSEPGVTYHWNFGDQSDANGENVTHTYSLYPEHYQVCVTITNGTGCTDDYCETIFVQTGPDCEGTFTYTVNDNVVSFVGDANVPGVSYYWFFDDGSNAATGQTQTHTFALYPEHYNVCMVIVNGNIGCQDTVCQSVYVQHGPSTCHADFDAASTCLGETIHFADLSTVSVGSITSWSWDFGDNAPPSELQNPLHTYASHGVYSVCLTITTSEGCTNTYCSTATVYPVPEALYSVQSSGNIVSFTNASTIGFNGSIVAWEWDFGDGETVNIQNSTHTYTTSGTYVVCLTVVSDQGCVDEYCHDVVISPPGDCEASFTYTVSNNTVTFAGSSTQPNVDYHWIFGDGSDANGQNVYHNYTQYPEHYIACLVIHNTSIGCIDTVCQNIYVPGAACQAYFTTTNSLNIFSVQNYSQGNDLSYEWTYGDGEVATGANPPPHTYTTSGNYDICLTVYNSAGCQSTYCRLVHVTVPTTCEASYTYTVNGNTVAFAGLSSTPNVDYHWIFGDGSDANGQNVTHTFTQSPEHYNVCLVIHNSNIGCIDTVCQSVFVEGVTNPCEASFTYAVNGNNVTFTGASSEPGVHYYWQFGDGSTGDGQTNTHTYTAYPEHYNACLIIFNNNTGCRDTVCQNIYVQSGTSECEASFTASISGTEVHFHGQSTVPGVTYTWNFGDGTSATGENPVHNYTIAPEHYTVCLTISNNNGCSDEACETIYIQSNNNTTCDASFTFSISGSEVHFNGASSVPGVYYYWSFGDGTTGGGENPVHNYADSTAHYNVCLTIYNGNGCQNTQCETITITGSPNNSDCQGDFNYTMQGNVVTFHGMSSVPGVYYYWNFGDGESGSGENPTHTFTSFPEHYNVCLTIYNNNGCQNTICQTIYVQSSNGSGDDCQASFTYEITDNSVHFFGESNQDNVTYAWIFGDNSTGQGNDPHHTYTQFPEHYNVCLIISNNANGCSDTVCQTIYIQQGSQGTCSAEFTYTITGNEVHFAGPSNAPGTHYQWSFGDGSSGDLHNPNHTYTLFPEHYEVCLTVYNPANNCNETVCHTIFIQSGNNTSQLYELSGTIYTGQAYADQGYVLLIQYDANLGTLQAVQTIGIGANGHYFFHAPAGNYFLKAALSPTSAVYNSYLPTYYDHELFWSNAAVISLTANMNRSIHMVAGNNPGGPGFIGGLVTQGANKTQGPGDPVADVQVMLLSMDDEPLQCTTSNANGEFSFSNVAYGTYKVYGEVYNLTTTPAIVTVNSSEPQVVDVGLIITSKEVTTGVYEPAVINEATVGQVFPNPFKGDAAINITLQKDARLSIRLFDIGGRQVYSDMMNFGAGVQQVNLPVSALSAGIYCLTLTDEKANSSVSRKLVKTE